MMCPVCKRELAPTLSICFTCGAMMNDTVREELETKIARTSGPLSEPQARPAAPVRMEIKDEFDPIPQMPQPARPIATPAPQPAPARAFTSQFPRKTSPTLVDFQPKSPTVPDWRLQLQNAVRQRTSGTANTSAPADAVTPAIQRAAPTHGATALKAEPAAPPPPPATHSNDKVAAALKRIEASRKAFLPEESSAPAAATAKPAPARNYPFNVVSRSAETAPKPAATTAIAAMPAAAAKPKLVSSLRIEKKPYDTNKLPPIPKPAKLSTSFDMASDRSGQLHTTQPAIEVPSATPLIEEDIHQTTVEEPAHLTSSYDIEEIDDLPSFSSRFAAGAFDLILSGAATLVILSPFMVGGGSWISFSGAIAFAATLSLFLFLYLTASLSVWGKTFGMRIFSMELIDIEANAYPTVHQAAVSSAVYVLSMAFGGAGFLTVPFSEEKRAVHDIVSGTLLVREI